MPGATRGSGLLTLGGLLFGDTTLALLAALFFQARFLSRLLVLSGAVLFLLLLALFLLSLGVALVGDTTLALLAALFFQARFLSRLLALSGAVLFLLLLALFLLSLGVALVGDTTLALLAALFFQARFLSRLLVLSGAVLFLLLLARFRLLLFGAGLIAVLHPHAFEQLLQKVVVRLGAALPGSLFLSSSNQRLSAEGL